MDDRRDPPAPEPDHGADEPEPCPCGSPDHQPLRIGERLSPSGAGLGGVYVCPAESTHGLRGVL